MSKLWSSIINSALNKLTTIGRGTDAPVINTCLCMAPECPVCFPDIEVEEVPCPCCGELFRPCEDHAVCEWCYLNRDESEISYEQLMESLHIEQYGYENDTTFKDHTNLYNLGYVPEEKEDDDPSFYYRDPFEVDDPSEEDLSYDNYPYEDEEYSSEVTYLGISRDTAEVDEEDELPF
jgi:hypothetical protein